MILVICLVSMAIIAVLFVGGMELFILCGFLDDFSFAVFVVGLAILIISVLFNIVMEHVFGRAGSVSIIVFDVFNAFVRGCALFLLIVVPDIGVFVCHVFSVQFCFSRLVSFLSRDY